MWMWRLDKQKLVAFWTLRAILNHPARIYSTVLCSCCVGHEGHYGFIVLLFVLLSFLCRFRSTQSMSLLLHFLTALSCIGLRPRRNRWS
ncbi:hypothetical protein EV421DRAFT_1809874 [Armillaria borealis]|uniref:Uncharacterized protein n=1 Tax=Armillaria borealis TaxID=47425 RepID=A0AA39JI29_9AGAR|nr:hypothetical protein EV421DRAFT_1809874 [Armillaria borealis]